MRRTQRGRPRKRTAKRAENEPADIWKKRHTAAHVLAQAVLEVFPDAKFAIGPPIEDGFYYDFDLPRTLTPDDLGDLQTRMERIKKSNLTLTRTERERADAVAYEEGRGQTTKPN